MQSHRLRPLPLVAALGVLACLLPAAAARAAVTTFGSPLTVPATLDTAENLNYEGSNVALPGSIFHINHDGADTLLWNVALPQGQPAAPTGGQVTSVSLEGCARQPAGAPAPLTQIHFQQVTPLPEGGARIVSTTGAFDIPVCGAGGAGGSTVTTYQPSNFCVNQGDYVGFNDEGGFVPSETGPPPYPAGVPYMVIGRSAGATMDSFISNGGTNNGTTISPSNRTYHDGFASNSDEELLLRATLASGSDASDSCPGGTKSSYVPPTSGYSQTPGPQVHVGRQTDGINHRGIVAVAVYCHQAAGCSGALTLTAPGGRRAKKAHTSFSIPGGKTSHVPVRLSAAVVALARRRHGRGLAVKLTLASGATTIVQTITLRVF